MKYPRTYHLPWSPGATRDDRIQSDVSALIGNTIVVTEKMDGSNVCLSDSGVFARSHSGPPTHPSFDLLKARYAAVKGWLGPVAGDVHGIELFGEWCFAKHSIQYSELPDYLLIFGIRDPQEFRWWSWDSVVKECRNTLALEPAPVLYSGQVKSEQELESLTKRLASEPSACGGEREGVVVRFADEFDDNKFYTHVLKYVRENHVQTDVHWKNQEIVKNGLKND